MVGRTYTALTSFVMLAVFSGTTLAQEDAPKDKPSDVSVIRKAGGDFDVVAKDVRDIIGFGGRISVKDSRAKVLGGAAGEVDTDNASFETVVLAAGTVTMKGGLVNELKIAAGQVDLDISISGDGDVAAGQLSLGESMNVSGDMDILAGTADLKGNYAGDLTVDAESVKVAGNISGDLRINARRIKIEPGTVIGGDLVAPNLVSLPDGVIVGGDKKINKSSRVKREGRTITVDLDKDVEVAVGDKLDAKMDEARAKIDEAKAKADDMKAEVDEANAVADNVERKIDEALEGKDISTAAKNAIKDAARDKAKTITIDTDDFDLESDDVGLISPQPMGMRAWLTVLVTLAACGALALGMAPQFLVRATERLAKEPLPSFGIGAASLIAVPAALIAVGITIIGIPFAILGAAAYMIGIGLGLIALCLWGGLMVRTLANQPGQETRLPKLVGWTLMGFLALALVGAVPFVGRVIQVLAIVTGAGAVLSTAWALRNAKKSQGTA